MERTDQKPARPTPVADDINASATDLLARCATDYARAENVRRSMDHRVEVYGHATRRAS